MKVERNACAELYTINFLKFAKSFIIIEIEIVLIGKHKQGDFL